MRRQWLHDFAKFGAGLVVADFITLWWLSTQHLLPKVFLGLTVTDSMIVPNMVIDIFLIMILIHYGWNIGHIPHIKERMYLTLAGAIFTVVTIGHVSRVLFSGDLSIFGWDVPIFLSWVGVAIAGYLAYTSFYFAARMKH